MKVLTYNAAVGIATSIGTVTLAAHQILYSLVRFCCTLGDVLSSTSQAFLPQFTSKSDDGAFRFDMQVLCGSVVVPLWFRCGSVVVPFCSVYANFK